VIYTHDTYQVITRAAKYAVLFISLMFQAYFISVSASIALISLCSSSILKSRTKAAIVFINLSGLYTYLFVTLRSEGFSLLIGSIGLFVILGSTMYLTCRIDWRKMETEITVE